MPETPVYPSPVENSDVGAVNQGLETLVASGSDASAITQDWWVHLQTVDLMYVRKNQYNANASGPFDSPTITSNYLEVKYNVQTTDEVWEDATFSGELWKPQVLEMISSDSSTAGFGVHGVVNTSAAGYIRRKVRVDSVGEYLDPTGICTKRGTYRLDQMPGPYDISYDTSSQVNSNLQEVMGICSEDCASFIASLVSL